MLLRLGDGDSIKVIGQSLKVSQRSVRRIRHRIFEAFRSLLTEAFSLHWSEQ